MCVLHIKRVESSSKFCIYLTYIEDGGQFMVGGGMEKAARHCDCVHSAVYGHNTQ